MVWGELRSVNVFAIRITTLVEAGELTGYQVKRELDGEERYLITNQSTYTVHSAMLC